MQLGYTLAVGALALGAMTAAVVQHEHDNPRAVAAAASQVDKYRMFMYVAAQYMGSYGGGAATIPWATLRTVASAPSGAKNMSMPASWRVVAAADNTWVACTEMDERSLGIVQQLAVQGGQVLNPTQVAGTDFVVVGAAGDVSKAASCN